MVIDQDYLVAIYDLGVRAVVGAVITVQHFATDIERVTGQPVTDGRIIERLTNACAAAGLDPEKNSADYSRFTEILSIRDAIEHPRQETNYAGDQSGGWAHVPLAWMLSDRSRICLEGFSAWFGRLADAWTLAIEATSSGTTTLTIERGITSAWQAKKPPRNDTRSVESD